MQVVVKKPHISIDIRGDEIPENLIDVLKKDYGNDVEIINDPDEEYLNIEDTDWYNKMKKKMTPGKCIVKIKIGRRKN